MTTYEIRDDPDDLPIICATLAEAERRGSRRAARLGDEDAKAMLLRYNEDDCRATRAVREFLSAGAPGVPELGEV